MSKIKVIGNGFIQIGETTYGLKEYKKIEKYAFGYDEDPEEKSAYGIKLTPVTPSEENIKNGVNGSFFIATYTRDEEKDLEEDFDLIMSALKD